MNTFHGTTIIAVRRENEVVIGGDGQVSFGSSILKPNAKKLRKLCNGKVIVGFAGATADAFTLLDLFEKKLQQHQSNLLRSSVELARDWRMDKILRRLEAMLLVADQDLTLVLTGNGDVIEPDTGVIAIGSGGLYAQSAGLALLNHTNMDAMSIVKESLNIAQKFCVYTNDQHTFETITKGDDHEQK
jgi:ATP-dependent HslUV protease subunit HslV